MKCKHTKAKIEKSDKGFTASCPSCGLRSPFSEGPKEAREALSQLFANRVDGRGGWRPGSGKPKQYRKLVMKGYNICPKHDRKVKKVLSELNKRRKAQKKPPVKGISAAMRIILDHIDVAEIVEKEMATLA